MTEPIAVVWGLGIISALFGYYGFELRESSVEWIRSCAVGMFFMSLVFLDLVMFTVFRIAQTTPSLSFLSDNILLTGIKAAIAITSLAAFALILSIIFTLIMAFWDMAKRLGKRQRG